MADEIGKLKIAFDGDFNDIKMALSEVNSSLKNIGSEAGRVTGSFESLGSIVGGSLGVGLAIKALGQGFSFLSSGISKYLDEQPDVVMAQQELNDSFRELTEEVAPEVTNALTFAADAVGIITDRTEDLKEFRDVWQDLTDEDKGKEFGKGVKEVIEDVFEWLGNGGMPTKKDTEDDTNDESGSFWSFVSGASTGIFGEDNFISNWIDKLFLRMDEEDKYITFEQYAKGGVVE